MSSNKNLLPTYVEDIVAYFFEVNQELQSVAFKPELFYAQEPGEVIVNGPAPADWALYIRDDCHGRSARGKILIEGRELADVYTLSI